MTSETALPADNQHHRSHNTAALTLQSVHR